MGKFCVIALILTFGELGALRQEKRRAAIAIFAALMALVMFGAHLFYRDPDQQSFVHMVLTGLGIQE